MITAKKLQAAEAVFRRAAARAETYREARNALVRQAIAEGWTHRRIADVTGLARSRISQLAPPKTDDPEPEREAS
jgi:hypothetical protein